MYILYYIHVYITGNYIIGKKYEGGGLTIFWSNNLMKKKNIFNLQWKLIFEAEPKAIEIYSKLQYKTFKMNNKFSWNNIGENLI